MEVKFKHDGKDAVAVFDISGGYIDRSHSREFPPENVEPDVELVGIYVDDMELTPDDVDLSELESEAIEKYFDQHYEG